MAGPTGKGTGSMWGLWEKPVVAMKQQEASEQSRQTGGERRGLGIQHVGGNPSVGGLRTKLGVPR